MTKEMKAVVYQVETGYSREWGFLPFHLFEQKMKEESSSEKFDLTISKHIPVMETPVSGDSHFGMLDNLFALTNSPIEESDSLRTNFPKAHSLSVGDIVSLSSANENKFYYCNSFGWVEMNHEDLIEPV